MGMLLILLFVCRAEGSSKIHSRLEQQTSRLGQQMKSNGSSSSNNKSFPSSKTSPPKGKASPNSPMDDIERGVVRQNVSLLLAFIARLHLCVGVWIQGCIFQFSSAFLLLARAELMAEARVMDQLSSGDSSSDSNSSSSSSSDDSSSSDSEDERTTRTPAPAKHSMPVLSTSSESNSCHQERAGGLINTLSESLCTLSIFTRTFTDV